MQGNKLATSHVFANRIIAESTPTCSTRRAANEILHIDLLAQSSEKICDKSHVNFEKSNVDRLIKFGKDFTLFERKNGTNWWKFRSPDRSSNGN